MLSIRFDRRCHACCVTVCAVALAVAGASCMQADEPGNVTTPAALAQRASAETAIGQEPRAPIQTAELNDVRLIFGELNEQVRIAEAKLEPDAMTRKRNMGRLQALLKETDEQIVVISAKIQRLKERQRQMVQQVSGIPNSTGTGSRSQALIERYKEPLQTEQTRLESLTRSRAVLQNKLERLRGEHLTELLDAAVEREAYNSPPTSALERVLEKLYE